jgi:hypothetical protein
MLTGLPVARITIVHQPVAAIDISVDSGTQETQKAGK